MSYDSTITFTLDTICPWTYLAKRRLDIALDKVRAENPPVNFTVKYAPYQLFNDAPEAGEDKWEWYKTNKYQGSEEQMNKFQTLMQAYGVGVGINFSFKGTVASTLNAHRVVQHYQEAKGPEVADKLISSLYNQYFEKEKHPSSPETLLTATRAAGIPDSEAEPFVNDPDEGAMETKMLIREQAGNGIDAVPHVILEGKRRDLTLEGAKEVEEYVKALHTIIKEAQ